MSFLNFFEVAVAGTLLPAVEPGAGPGPRVALVSPGNLGGHIGIPSDPAAP